MGKWVLWTILASALLALGYIGYRGAVSPTRPIAIPFAAWRRAFEAVQTHRSVVLGVTLLICAGVSLQLSFTSHFAPNAHQRSLLAASILWQAIMASAVAAIVVPFQLCVARETRHLVDIPNHAARSQAAIVRAAAAYGFGIWLFSYLLGVASKFLLQFAPIALRPTSYYLLTGAAFLITTLLTLVRPCLSLGYAHPLRSGARLAISNAAALFVMTIALAMPPIVIELMLTYIPAAFLVPALPREIFGVVAYSAFSIFQVLAVEASTVVFARRAFWLASRIADEEIATDGRAVAGWI